jgi:hypothetical protein
MLGVDSRDFPHAEKEIAACKAEKIKKTTTIFTQNAPRLSFFVNLLSFASSFFFHSLRKIT